MTQHSQNGEVLFRAFMAGDVSRLTTTALPDEWSHMKPSYQQAWNDLAASLAREPATAAVGQIVAELRNPWEGLPNGLGLKRGECPRWACDLMTRAADKIAALSRAAPSSVDHKPGCEHSRAPIKLCDCPAAPTSEPAIAEGELAGIMACMDEMLADPKLDALAFDKHDSRIIRAALAALPSKDATIAEAVERMRADPFIDDAHLLGTTSQDQRMKHYAAIALATTPPTTNDAIPAGWKLVPVEPTEAMKQAGEMALDTRGLVVDYDDGLAVWSAMLSAAPSAPATEAGARYRHVKRGTEYEVIGVARLQNARNVFLDDGDHIVVYRGDDGQLWARECDEFHDGRFTPTDQVKDGKVGVA